MLQYVIQADNLSKTYGRTSAVQSLSIAVPYGTICGFLGRNGSGKTTTLKMLLGLTRPGGGEAWVLGRKIDDEMQSVEIRRRTGYVGENKDLWPQLTVDQTLRVVRSVSSNWREDLERKYIDTFELPRKKRVEQLSKGMRSKLALLLAFCRKPDLLILDEPTDGLDPLGVEQVLQTIVSAAAEGSSVFFSSHQLHEVEQISDYLVMIDRGRLLLEGELDEIRASHHRIRMVFPSDVPASIRSRGGSIAADGRSVSMVVIGEPEATVDMARSCGAFSIDVEPMALREIFLDRVLDKQEVH